MTETTDWNDDILGEDTTEEGLIELTDIVEEDSETPEDEVIVELTDIAEDDAKEVEEPEPMVLEMEDDEAPEDDFFSGEEISSDDEIEIGGIEEEPLSFDDEPEDIEEENVFDTGDEEVEEGLPMPEEVAAASVLPETPAAPAIETDVTMEDLETALERVIEKKFSDKIETILFEVMERVIENEIAQIKESLQKDLDQIGHG